MNIALQLRNLNKSFAGQTVLSDISLEVTTHSIHGLVGLNGAGKTSLIKCILDLQSADSGEILIHNISSELTDSRHPLIYLAERFAAPDYMTGWTYLRFIADAYLPAPQRREVNADAVTLCAKLDFPTAALDKSVQTLSKGMTQKLGIMGCLISKKPFLILDEPMSGLDPKARVQFRQVIGELKSEGRTVLMCSHILSDIETLCDSITILHQGRILYSGTAENCVRQYGAQDFETAFLKCIEN
ncbi:MAG TPA: ABC transporter ATP-binding protein [Gammaproteobacteria bacterium]|nr:ABC transporter ATP-binding protein [Gammaproteobacteria bacterium]